jgi:DEAD/DEAH box helicase domain-containing protein
VHDVVGAYQRLNHIYQLYIKSAFPLRYRSLATERDRLLQQPGILSQPPLIEPVPIYPSSGRDLQTAAKQLPVKYHDLAQLGKMLFEGGIELYQHQWESLESVLINQKDLVVTTGTGSGKTECFLLPLLAHLAWESSTWEASPPPPSHHCWWDGKADSERISQWEQNFLDVMTNSLLSLLENNNSQKPTRENLWFNIKLPLQSLPNLCSLIH